MKKDLRLLWVLLLLCFQTAAFANMVIVKGTIKDSNNVYLSNRLVKIYSADTSNRGCLISHNVFTNPNGFYIDTLKCTGDDIRKLYIVVENCNGTKITRDPAVTSSGILEVNFIICAKQTNPQPIPGCKAYFTSLVTDSIAKFNSAGSQSSVSPGLALDSIVSRTWYFMDNKPNYTTITGNRIDPSFTYKQPGTYQVYLVIKTKLGCESKYANTIIISKVVCTAKANFSSEKISLKKVIFNSNLSTVQPGDSIIQRTWKFGDNSYQTGNQIKIEREYPTQGIYTACLQIKTLNGCVTDTCKKVVVQDTSNIPPTTRDFIKILAINPNPVIYNFRATIYSSTKDIESEINVYDIYGVLKSSMKMVLAKGNNIVEIQTSNLHHGPYFLRVISKSGKDSKIFYKL